MREAVIADEEQVSVNLRLRSPPGLGPVVFTAREWNPLFLGILHDRLGQRMLRVGVNRRRNAQDFPLGFPVP